MGEVSQKARAHSLLRRFGLSWPIGLFLLSAALGAWIAYDRRAAWDGLITAVAAVVVYIAVACAPDRLHIGGRSFSPLHVTFAVLPVGIMLLGIAAGDWSSRAGKLSCFVLFTPEPVFARGGYLRAIAVAPEARNQGVGKALLRFAEQETARLAPNLYLCVSSFNLKTGAFYRHFGYKKIGTIPGLIVPGAFGTDTLETAVGALSRPAETKVGKWALMHGQC